MKSELRVFPDRTALARAAAVRFVEIAQASVALNQRFTVALSGGSTPEPMYRLLATPEYACQIDWRQTHLFWSDERCVPPNHPDSNYGLASRAFIDQVPVSMENVYRILGEEVPEAAAERYERELKGHFKVGGPRFDLILLGLGEDGHTASIFPGSTAAIESKRFAVAVQHPDSDQWRITLTLTAINESANVMFQVAGESKRNILKVVRSGATAQYEVPAIGVDPRDGAVLWLCDQAASPL